MNSVSEIELKIDWKKMSKAFNLLLYLLASGGLNFTLHIYLNLNRKNKQMVQKIV